MNDQFVDDAVVDHELQLAEAAMLQRHFGFNFIAQELFGHKLGIDLSQDQFRPAFDANLNGHIDPVDMAAIIANGGSGDAIPLQANMTLVQNGAVGSTNGEAEFGAAVKLSDFSFSVHQNPAMPADVNADGRVTPLDALLTVNTINQNGSISLDTTLGNSDAADGEHVPSTVIAPPFYDVSGDSMITPVDVLLVVNDLNTDAASSPTMQGEGESRMGHRAAMSRMPVEPLGTPNIDGRLAVTAAPHVVALGSERTAMDDADLVHPPVNTQVERAQRT